MKPVNEQWPIDLENLIIEIMVAEKVYGTIIQADRHPHKSPYFKKRHFKLQRFAHNLSEEFYILEGRKPSVSEKANLAIFNSRNFLEDKMTDRELDFLIMEKEQALSVQYQKVLAYNSLPATTNAILQSQAEELNNLIQELLLDYKINLRRESTTI